MNPQLQRGLLLYQQSRYEMAETEFRQALATDPDDAYAHSMLSLCLVEREQFDPATAEAMQGVHLAPDEPFAHYALARVFSSRNHYADALNAIQEAIRLDPSDADYFAALANIHVQEERWRDALQAAERGMEQDAEHVGCTNLRAIALVKLGRRDEAGATIEEALKKAPENAFTHANQGWTYLNKGEPNKALEHFRESLRLDPANEWARQGIVEALKARNIIYAVMLKYFLWMARLSRGARWGIILGGYFGNQILAGMARSNPAVAPWVLPLRILYITFAVMTWLAYPLFNLMLRMSRFGRLALLPEQIVESNWVGTSLLFALLSFSAYLVSDNWLPWLYATLVFGLMMLPLTGVFRCSVGWPRWTMIGLTAALFLLGTAATGFFWRALSVGEGGQEIADVAGSFLMAFSFGILLSQFAVNYLAGQKVKR
jgi:tetratricopeptide (TPR) repeat protein